MSRNLDLAQHQLERVCLGDALNETVSPRLGVVFNFNTWPRSVSGIALKISTQLVRYLVRKAD